MRLAQIAAATVVVLALGVGLVMSPPPARADITITLWVTCNSDGKYHISGGDGGAEYIDGSCGGPIMTTAGDTGVKLVVGGRTEMSAAGRAFLNRLDSGDIRIGTLRRIPGGQARSLPGQLGKTQTILVATRDVGPGLSALLKQTNPGWGRQAPVQPPANH